MTLGNFGFKVGGGNASGSCAEATAGLASGANPFDRLWEMVPIVVESLIRGGGVIASERVERVDPPRGRGPNLEVAGEESWIGSTSRTVVKDSSTGIGGRCCDRFASR